MNLDRLQTNEEKEAFEKKMDEYRNNPTNDYDDINWEGYMSRQPRFDLRKHNFNFEEYDRYIDMFEQASKKDKDDSIKFYKMVKYVRSKLEAGETNMAVNDFVKKYKLDLIEMYWKEGN